MEERLDTSDNVSAINRAHENGRLFVHMFEHSPHHDPFTLQLVGVMNGDHEATYKNPWQEVSGTENGHVALATTALKKDIPMPVWGLASKIGLLLDGNDQEKIKPVFISSKDAGTNIHDGNTLAITQHEEDDFKALRDIQGIDSEATSIVVTNNQEAKTKQAGRAIDKYWQLVDEIGFKNIQKQRSGKVSDLNQMNVMAQSGAIKGIVVAAQSGRSLNRISARSEDGKNIAQAAKVRHLLIENFPDLFDESIPIMSYDPTRKKEPLVEITPMVLQTFERADKSNLFGWFR